MVHNGPTSHHSSAMRHHVFAQWIDGERERDDREREGEGEEERWGGEGGGGGGGGLY